MIQKIGNMCQQQNFDRTEAVKILKQINVNEAFVPDNYGYATMLLEWAAMWANLSMVELLLEYGADPNLVFHDESTLWNLQYNDGETDEENGQRLLIAQRLLEYGADPLVDPDKTGEPLLDYVVFAVFNDDDAEDLWNYRSRFLILLVAFGAKSKYCTPRIVGEFDKSNMKKYKFYMVPEKNGKYSGVITDGQGNDIAYV